MKIIINENERGLLFKDGKYEKMLEPGKHYSLTSTIKVVKLRITEEFKLTGYNLDVFLTDKKLREQLEIIDISDET